MSRTDARILVAADKVTVTFGAAEEVCLSFEPRSAQAAGVALTAALHRVRERGGGSAAVRLSGIWLRWQSLPWGATSVDEAGMRTVVAPQAYRMPGMLARVPTELLAVLEVQVPALRLHLAAVPEMALGRLMRQEPVNDAVVAILEQDSLTFLRVKDGFVADVVVYPGGVAGGEALSALEAAWHRLGLRNPAFAGCFQRLFVETAGVLPEAAAPASFRRIPAGSDFLWSDAAPLLSWPLRPSTWRSGKGLALAASFGLLLWAGSQFHTARHEREQQVAEQASLVAGGAQTPVRDPATQKERALLISRVNDALRQLNAPVDRLLKAVAPRRGSNIVLLGVQLRSGKERVLVVEGSARTMQDMASYVKYLSMQPVFASVWLSRHESAAADTSAGYRFMIEAGWRE